jgi:site-specific DNA recombinase
MKTQRAVVAAIYARVSSEQQSEAGTIDSQVEALRARVTSEGFGLTEELCFIDDGYSGATLIRPALERLRDVAATGAIDCLYVHSPDRLARKYAYQVLLLEELHGCGVEVVFLTNAVGTTPEEHLLLQVQGMVAEYERARLMERSRRGKLHRAREGSLSVLGHAPYGYRYVSAQEGDGQARYEIVVEEARVVRRVYEWLARDRLSIGEICRRLEQKKLLTPTGKTHWDRSTVHGMLKNPAYRGMAAFGKTRAGPRRAKPRPQRGQPAQPKKPISIYQVAREDWIEIPVPAIVSESLYLAAQEQLEENRRRQRQRAGKSRFLLQGLLVCKHCGYAYCGTQSSRSKSRQYAYYRCTGADAFRFGGQRLCRNKPVRTDKIDQAVWEDVRSFLENPGRMEQEYRRRLRARKTQETWESPKRIASLIKKAKRGIARLIDAYADGLIEHDEFQPRIQNAKRRLTDLEAEFQERSSEQAAWEEMQEVVGRLQQFAQKIRDGLDEADHETRQKVLRALVKKIEVDDKQVRVVYRVDPHPFDQAPDRGASQHCLRRYGSGTGRIRQMQIT